MPTPTYTALANITLGSSASSVTFSSIPATYRDLILVATAQSTPTPAGFLVNFNGDTGSNYTTVVMTGVASAAETFTSGQLTYFVQIPSDAQNVLIAQFLDYSATDKHKTYLSRNNSKGEGVEASAGRWANTAAITSMVFTCSGGDTWASGSGFSLYGIAS
jgi:peptide methionine sulfoxide reductase MsrA